MCCGRMEAAFSKKVTGLSGVNETAIPSEASLGRNLVARTDLLVVNWSVMAPSRFIGVLMIRSRVVTYRTTSMLEVESENEAKRART